MDISKSTISPFNSHSVSYSWFHLDGNAHFYLYLTESSERSSGGRHLLHFLTERKHAKF